MRVLGRCVPSFMPIEPTAYMEVDKVFFVFFLGGGGGGGIKID